MNRNLSFSQRLHNAMGVQAIEQDKAIHAYTHAIMYSREEWDRIWYKDEKNATWAHGFGRMVGWNEVYYNSVTKTDYGITRMNLESAVAFPKAMGSDVRSFGKSALHALSIGVIEIADDGKSGRAFYLTPGTMIETVGGGDVRRGGWLWERYGSDFVYKDGRWLYLHEHVCPDFGGSYDNSNWGQDMMKKELAAGDVGGPQMNGPQGGAEVMPLKLTEPGKLHYDASMTQVRQNTCPPPKPYKTLDDENSYSPGYNDV